MYQFIDREIARLERRERMLVLAMRDWVAAVRRERCPIEAVSLRFVSHRVVGGIEPFHAAMATLARHGRQRLVLCCPCSPHVGEGEAILLAALVGAERARRRAETGHLVAPEHGARLADALAELDAALWLAGMC